MVLVVPPSAFTSLSAPWPRRSAPRPSARCTDGPGRIAGIASFQLSVKAGRGALYCSPSDRTRPPASPRERPGLVVSELSLGTWGLSAAKRYGPGRRPRTPEADDRPGARHRASRSFLDTADSVRRRRDGSAPRARAQRQEPANEPLVVTQRTGPTGRPSQPAKHYRPASVPPVARLRPSLKRIRRERTSTSLPPAQPEHRVGRGARARLTGLMEALKKGKLILHWAVAAGDAEMARAAIDKGAEVIEIAYNLAARLRSVSPPRGGDVMVASTGVLAGATLSCTASPARRCGRRIATFNEATITAPNRWTKLELARRIEQLEAVRYLVRGDVHRGARPAVRFVLANHLVSSCVLGAKSITQLEQLVRETGGGPQLYAGRRPRRRSRACSRERRGAHVTFDRAGADRRTCARRSRATPSDVLSRDLHFGEFDVEYKGRADPFTLADREAGALICDALSRGGRPCRSSPKRAPERPTPASPRPRPRGSSTLSTARASSSRETASSA